MTEKALAKKIVQTLDSSGPTIKCAIEGHLGRPAPCKYYPKTIEARTHSVCFSCVTNPDAVRAFEKCKFEGIAYRPSDCKSNPKKFPETYNPEACRKCEKDPGMPTVATQELPSIYLEFKQGKRKNP
jgi:hypothetical protein